MKITIFSPEPPFVRGYEVRRSDTGKRIQNSHKSLFCSDFFDEDEIRFIIGEKRFDTFNNEGKYEFDVPVWKIKTISGDHVSKNREQLIYSANWNNL